MPGVAEVNTIGGYEKQFHVLPDPARLIAYRLSFRDVMTALAANNANVGAGYIERNGEQYLVRTPGQVATIDEIRDIVIGTAQRRADPHRATSPRSARAASCAPARPRENGEEAVLGTAMHADRREQPHRRRSASPRKLEEIARVAARGRRRPHGLRPHGAGRGDHRDRREEPARGRAAGHRVLFLLLGNFRAAIVTACVIPLSMLFTVTGMVESRISGNLMSLGAIDFGLIVDGAVIIVENCLRLLAAGAAAARPRC